MIHNLLKKICIKIALSIFICFMLCNFTLEAEAFTFCCECKDPNTSKYWCTWLFDFPTPSRHNRCLSECGSKGYEYSKHETFEHDLECHSDGKCKSPTFIELNYLIAEAGVSLVTLEWETDMEIDNAGFNIWRSEQEDGGYSVINETLIPAQGSGSFYSYADDNVINGTTYYYMIEDIDLYGVSTLHGPVYATPNAIILLNPEEGTVLISEIPPTFEWTSDDYTKFKLIFAVQGIKKNLGRGWTSDNSFTPLARKWEKFTNRLKSDELVYWLIIGKDDRGNKVQSEIRSFMVEK